MLPSASRSVMVRLSPLTSAHVEELLRRREQERLVAGLVAAAEALAFKLDCAQVDAFNARRIHKHFAPWQRRVAACAGQTGGTISAPKFSA